MLDLAKRTAETGNVAGAVGELMAGPLMFKGAKLAPAIGETVASGAKTIVTNPSVRGAAGSVALVAAMPEIVSHPYISAAIAGAIAGKTVLPGIFGRLSGAVEVARDVLGKAGSKAAKVKAESDLRAAQGRLDKFVEAQTKRARKTAFDQRTAQLQAALKELRSQGPEGTPAPSTSIPAIAPPPQAPLVPPPPTVTVPGEIGPRLVSPAPETPTGFSNLTGVPPGSGKSLIERMTSLSTTLGRKGYSAADIEKGLLQTFKKEAPDPKLAKTLSEAAMSPTIAESGSALSPKVGISQVAEGLAAKQSLIEIADYLVRREGHTHYQAVKAARDALRSKKGKLTPAQAFELKQLPGPISKSFQLSDLKPYKP